jgi:hypothetical protein
MPWAAIQDSFLPAYLHLFGLATVIGISFTVLAVLEHVLKVVLHLLKSISFCGRGNIRSDLSNMSDVRQLALACFLSAIHVKVLTHADEITAYLTIEFVHQRLF